MKRCSVDQGTFFYGLVGRLIIPGCRGERELRWLNVAVHPK